MPIIESVMGIQVIGNNGENIIKSPIVEAYIGSSLLDSTEVASDTPTDISTKVEQLMAAKHSHSNKAVLDKFAEGSDGKPTYDGQALGGGGGAGDLVIKMTVEGDGDGNYTVTSCDTTVEQIDAAVSVEKSVVVTASCDGMIFELPMIQGLQDNFYYFGAFLLGQMAVSYVEKIGGNTSEWQFSVTPIGAESVDYSNDALPSVTNVKAALDELVPKSHTHATGTNITLADNTEYRLMDVTTLSLSYPTGNFECWMRLTFAASGNITVTLPADSEYLGATPNFKNGETWELSFKDKVLAAKKVGDDDKDAEGENGTTPHIGENGNWYIGNTDTGKPSRGEKGDTGASGSPGADGVTPHIGDNGNWYIGSTDTGKPSRGVAGAKGDAGAPGKDGANGKDGAQGEKGADGKTPVKGADYWTAADKQEIVNDVIAALPDGTEVSY